MRAKDTRNVPGRDASPRRPRTVRGTVPAKAKVLEKTCAWVRISPTFCIWLMPAACLLPLAGCMVGPDYHAPEVSAPQSWIGAGTNAIPAKPAAAYSVPTSASVVLTNWWAAFKEPTLDSLVTRALQANLDLRQAESRIRQARAQRGVVAGAFWPSADASGEYRHSRQNGAGLGSANLYQAGLDATWELDVFGGTRRAMEAASSDIAASIEDRRDVAVTLVAEVALNYISLRGLQREIMIAKENLKAQAHSVEITRQRFRGGFIGKLDVANAEAQVATTQSQIPVLESAARQTIYALGLLLAREPAALVDELSTGELIPLIPPEVPVGKNDFVVTVATRSDVQGKRPRSSLADWAERNAESWGDRLNSEDVEGFTGRRF